MKDFVVLWNAHAEWSRKTFGPDNERGPIGPLKHLAKEAQEAQLKPTDFTEYADCLLCLIDAARRAGMTPGGLLREAEDKLQVNKFRQWGTPIDDDSPIEHIRSLEGQS
jgi:hypothetical protein